MIIDDASFVVAAAGVAVDVLVPGVNDVIVVTLSNAVSVVRLLAPLCSSSRDKCVRVNDVGCCCWGLAEVSRLLFGGFFDENIVIVGRRAGNDRTGFTRRQARDSPLFRIWNAKADQLSHHFDSTCSQQTCVNDVFSTESIQKIHRSVLQASCKDFFFHALISHRMSIARIMRKMQREEKWKIFLNLRFFPVAMGFENDLWKIPEVAVDRRKLDFTI